jgi:hypothetical protein
MIRLIVDDTIPNIDPIGAAITDLVEAYLDGDIKGIMIQYISKDGGLAVSSVGDIGYLEKIGILETAKDALTEMEFV